MKFWRSMLAMLLCSGLLIALGLNACGDDDEEEAGMTCEEALATLTSDTCIDAVEDELPVVQNCIDACDPPGDEDCIDDCLDIEGVLPSSCVQAIGMLLDDEDAVCGACFVTCGQDLVDCIVEGSAPETCLTLLSGCTAQCGLP